MLNRLLIVGTLAKDPELKETESGKKVVNTTIAIQRDYKNKEGKYDVDFIDCVLWNGVAENACTYLKKGDLVGVNGKLGTTKDKNGNKVMNVVVEKMSFIQTHNKEKKKENLER